MTQKRANSNSSRSGRSIPGKRPPDIARRDSKQPRTSIRFAQNFLRDSSLVASIIAGVELGRNDVVYEIGPGEGIITLELSKVCSKVIAIEIEPRLVKRLKARFGNIHNIEIVNADFMQLRLPDQEYKVFSNIPFNITADLLRKLLYTEHPPTKAYLILQREAAEKYAGVPKETQVSILLKPWFSYSVLRKFERTDFDPVPSVDTVLFGVERVRCPLVSSDEASLYRRFVTYGFSRWKASLGKNYKAVFSHLQWKRLARDLAFDNRAQPTDLTFEQWLGIFRFFMSATKKGQVKVPADLLVHTDDQVSSRDGPGGSRPDAA